MSYDYSKIVAIYKDRMELFRLYEGSVMLWEKPLKRIYMWVTEQQQLEDLINGISAATGHVIGMGDIINFNNSIKATSDSGYLIELYVEESFDGSAVASLLTDIEDVRTNVEDSVYGSATPSSGTVKKMNLKEKITVKSSFSVFIDNNIYFGTDMGAWLDGGVKPSIIGSIWYIPKVTNTINIGTSIKSVVDTITSISVDVLNGLDTDIHITLPDMMECKVYSFDSLSSYINFMNLNGMNTSISAVDGLGSNIRVTLFRLSMLSDFDSEYLYNIDEETLEELKLVEE